MLHSRLLTYLDEVARAGSMREAAARLGVAPSSISRQIAELEADLSVVLFARSGGRLSLTPAGELVIAHARQSLQGQDTLMRRLADLTAPGRGTLAIATMNGLIGGLVARALTGFSQRFPGVLCTVSSRSGGEIVAALLAGQADLGIGYNMGRAAGLRVRTERAVRVVAAVAPTHPLARAKAIRFSQAVEYPAILADETMSLHAVVSEAFERQRVQMNVVLKSDSMGLIKRFLSDGQSIAYLSEADVAAETREGTLVSLTIMEGSMRSQMLSLVEREAPEPGGTAALFAEDFAERLGSF